MVQTETVWQGVTRYELGQAARNHGMQLEGLRYDTTPAGMHYLVIHWDIPPADEASWTVEVDGLVERPLSLSIDDLRSRPAVTRPITMECAGNGRALMPPRAESQPWLDGAVGNAEWTGTPLPSLLEEAGLLPDAVELLFTGADHGIQGGVEQDYQWSFSLEDIVRDDVLLAYEMNGAALAPEHGFPVRLVVPGYYGTNSVKWLWRLQLTDRRAEGLFASQLYNDAADPEEIAAGQPERRPVWAIAPESIIVAPAPDAVLARGEAVEIWGWAWSFRGVARVEVSSDGGASFREATLEPRRGWQWQRFSLSWQPERRGETLLAARAFDSDGTAQPLDGARNAVHTVRVEVR
jgi:DMSO/TMAO reductase YedYZ molybdopterin-dependent catalytic subunit